MQVLLCQLLLALSGALHVIQQHFCFHNYWLVVNQSAGAHQLKELLSELMNV